MSVAEIDLGSEWQEAIEANAVERVAELLKGHPRLLRQRLIKYREDGTWYVLNPLIAACDNNSLALARVLVAAGADVNERNPDGGGTALGPDVSPELADFLLDSGADIDAVGYEESTPLICAAYCGNVVLVERLIERGADVNRVNPREGGSALHYAALCRPRLRGFDSDADFDPQPFRTIVGMLLDAGAQINARCNDGVETDAGPLVLRGETALHFAAASGDPVLVRLLVDSGADVEARNALGESARDWAAKYGASAEVGKVLGAE